MTVALAPAAPRMLPVWSTVAACYLAVARNIGQLVRISWLWLLVLVLLYAATLWLVWTISASGSSVLLINTVAQLPTVIDLPILGSIAVAWHRLLLRAERVTNTVYLRLDNIVWRYALLSLVLLVFPLLIVSIYLYVPPADWHGGLRPDRFLLLSHAVAALVIGVGLASIPVVARLSLMLPAVALGDNASPARIWQMTRHNTLRLATSTILCGAPLMLLSLLVRRLDDTTSLTAYVIGGLIELAGGAVLMTFGVTLLSLAYRFFATPHEERAPAA